MLHLLIIDLANLDFTALLTITGPILIALIGGYVTVQQAKKKAKSDVQTVLNEGFTILLKQHQEERTNLMSIIERQGTEIAEQTKEILSLKTQIRRLMRHVIKLEKTITDVGAQLPAIDNED